MHYAAFYDDETGAITVDWTVMTAAIAGLGMATYGVVSNGISNSSSDIDLTLRGVITDAEPTLVTDFSDGMGPFQGGVHLDVPGMGQMLVIDGTHSRGGIATQASIPLNPNYDYAQVGFDMAFIDSWDGEKGYVYINGQRVAVGNFTHENHPSLSVDDLPPEMEDLGIVSIEFGEAEAIEGAGYFTGSGGANWNDYRQPVSMVIETNGASEFDLGFGTNLNSPYGDESLGIDNLTVISTDTIE